MSLSAADIIALTGLGTTVVGTVVGAWIGGRLAADATRESAAISSAAARDAAQTQIRVARDDRLFEPRREALTGLVASMLRVDDPESPVAQACFLWSRPRDEHEKVHRAAKDELRRMDRQAVAATLLCADEPMLLALTAARVEIAKVGTEATRVFAFALQAAAQRLSTPDSKREYQELRTATAAALRRLEDATEALIEASREHLGTGAPD